MSLKQIKNRWFVVVLSILILVFVTGLILSITKGDQNYLIYASILTGATLFCSIFVALLSNRGKKIKNLNKERNDTVLNQIDGVVPDAEYRSDDIGIHDIQSSEDIPESNDDIFEKVDTFLFSSMTVIQLRDYAKAKGYTGYTSLKKADLVNFIKDRE